MTFRRAYDALQAEMPGIKGDVEYLRILHLAASTMEADVEQSLVALLAEGAAALTADATKVRCGGTGVAEPPVLPDIAALQVDLAAYDALLEAVAS